MHEINQVPHKFWGRKAEEKKKSNGCTITTNTFDTLQDLNIFFRICIHMAYFQIPFCLWGSRQKRWSGAGYAAVLEWTRSYFILNYGSSQCWTAMGFILMDCNGFHRKWIQGCFICPFFSFISKVIKNVHMVKQGNKGNVWLWNSLY